MSRQRRLPSQALLLALTLAGCQSGVGPTASMPSPGANPNDARWAEVATALVIAGRSAEASIRVADRLAAPAKVKAFHLLQADDDAEEADEDAPTAEADDADEDEDFDLGDFDDDVEEAVGSATLAELEEDDWEEWEDLDVEEGDQEWEQAIDVNDDDLADLSGDLKVEDLVDAKGKLKAVEFNYTPDEKAKAMGVSSHTIQAKVKGQGAEVTVKAGPQDFQNVKWGSADFKLTYEQLASGDRQFTGTCKTEDGRTFNVTGTAYKDGTNDMTMSTGTMTLAFRGVKEPVEAFGYILDRAPTDPQAMALGFIQAHRDQPTTIQFYTEGVPYQTLLSTPPKPTLAALAGVREAGLGFAVDARSPWQTLTTDPGRHERQAVWSVKPADMLAHTVVVNEVRYPVTSDRADTIALVDRTAKSSLRFSLPHSLTRATLTDGHAQVEIAPTPDGGYMVNGHAAADAKAAARLLVAEPVGAEASLENLSALDFALLSKELHATRGQMGSNCPPPTVPPRVPHGPNGEYRVLALGDAPAEEAMAPFAAVIQEAIALREGR